MAVGMSMNRLKYHHGEWDAERYSFDIVQKCFDAIVDTCAFSLFFPHLAGPSSEYSSKAFLAKNAIRRPISATGGRRKEGPSL
jgi:hypothetical protein